ncbi:hypothetical protein MSPP1_001265 [Malassezia sp. CBS 17886]|nr:hypothetical protein MSPP1_001265 [Malassezia sp. CBS 17886]
MPEDATDEVKVALDEATRLFALKQYESASDMIASALETLRDRYGEDAPELAPVLHQYGRALLEHAIATSGALAGGEVSPGSGGEEDDPTSSTDMAHFSFADGDGAQDGAENGEGDEGAAAAEEREARNAALEAGTSKTLGKRKTEDVADGEGGEEPVMDNEEEDDMSTAFTVLDLARVIYERILNASASIPAGSASAEKKMKTTAELHLITGEVWHERTLQMELAEVRNALGDIGLETENFEQAAVDYAAALEILQPLLPTYSRRMSDAYLRLGLALEFHPEMSRRGDAPTHIEQAMHVLQRRLEALRSVGEGNATPPAHASEKDNLSLLDADQLMRETKDVEEMIGELNSKLEEMKAPGNALKEDGTLSNPALEDAIREAFLGAASSLLGEGSAPASAQEVTDLSSRVKKKKK